LTLDRLVQKLSLREIDLIKIDVEGAELEVLEGGKEALDITKTVVIDMHYPLGSPRSHTIVDFMSSKGFAVKWLRDLAEGYPRYLYCVKLL
jgi:hypothetical protein